MKHKIIIEYETPDNSDIQSFNNKIAELKARKAVGDYLSQIEEIRRNSLERLYKISSSTSESYIEIHT